MSTIYIYIKAIKNIFYGLYMIQGIINMLKNESAQIQSQNKHKPYISSFEFQRCLNRLNPTSYAEVLHFEVFSK